MFASLSNIVDQRVTRVILFTLGIPATIFLAPWAALGAYLGIEYGLLYRDAADVDTGYAYGFLGWGGLIGLAAAWSRIILRGARFHRSMALYALTVVGLLMGVATAVAQLIWTRGITADPLLWVFLGVFLLGLLLLSATVGTRTLRSNRTVERDEPPTARSSP